MFRISKDPRALKRAYCATCYGVRLPGGGVILRVGKSAPRLDRWLAGRRDSCWSLLTAWNPGGRLRPEARNRACQNSLARLLSRHGAPFFPGMNHAPSRHWPCEPTWFVPALDREAALRLARHFGQNAFLWGRMGKAVELVWCFPVTKRQIRPAKTL
jgi:hypothetical protein